MERPTRRSYLAATIAAGTAGCLGGDDPSTETDEEHGSTDVGTRGDLVTTDSRTRRLVVEGVDPARAAADGNLTVYPPALRRWLREAVDGTVRGHDESYLYMPEPVLPQFDAVRLESSTWDVDGNYDLTAEGGTRYQMMVGADPADPPADATVTPVEQLPADRRDLARDAIDPEEYVTVYPETELGEWVRTGFFGNYFEYDGETYRGKEVQQTDAEFFSTRVWYVLALSPEPSVGDRVTLRVGEIDPAVSDVIDDLLDERSRNEDRTALVFDDLADAAAAFFAETEYLLTHPEVLRVEIERY